AVFKDADFDDFEDKTRGSKAQREYCVQFQESDFAFVHRLMEEEGIYYFFKHENGRHKMIMTDDASVHEVYSDKFKDIEYFSAGTTGDYAETVTSWMATDEIQSGKVTLRDYDFEKPSANLEKVSSIKDATSYGDFERYEFPGKYTDPSI